MFQYALGRALALKHGVELKLDLGGYALDTVRHRIKSYFAAREYNLREFTISAEIASRADIPFLHRMYGNGIAMLVIDAIRRRILSHKGKERSRAFDPSIMSRGSDLYLEGDWQSPKYFAGYEDIIRADFQLNHPLSAKAQQLLTDIQSKNAVCVHIRRGDYVNNSTYALAQEEYYTKALEYIAGREQIDCVYVFDRDDIEWCKQHVHFKYPTIFIENDTTLAEHLMLMSACKHFVIANSSFSWWAAWLAPYVKKIVVAPQKWFAKDSISITDLIPPEWMRL